MGVGLKRVVTCSSLANKEAGNKTGSFLLGRKCFFFLTLTSQI